MDEKPAVSNNNISANNTSPTTFRIHKQHIASFGRYLTQDNEIKRPLSLIIETLLISLIISIACILSFVESPTNPITSTTGLALLTWITARCFSIYRRNALPGLGPLGNSALTLSTFLGSFNRPINTYQSEFDPRLLQNIQKGREQIEKSFALIPRQDVASQSEITIQVRDGTQLKVRLTYPLQNGATKKSNSLLPLAFYTHGGAFCTMSPKSMDFLQCQASNALQSIVAAPAYRLAPEYKFPTAHQDCIDAFEEVLKRAEEIGVDRSRCLVFGDSVGGHFAASLALASSRHLCCNDENGTENHDTLPTLRAPEGTKILAQLLLHPVVTPYLPTGSNVRLSSGPMIGNAVMTWAWNRYLPNPVKDMSDPRASLLLECVRDRIDFGKVPTSVIVTGGFDPLRDEGEMLAESLARGGVRVYASRRLEVHGLWVSVVLL